MPSIGDLQGVWRAVARSFGVGPGPVPADDLHSRVGWQPRGEGRSGAVGQHIDRAAGLDVDQDRAVVVSTAQREIVHTQNARGWSFRVGQGPDQAQQGHSADRCGQTAGQSRAGASAQRQRDRAECSLQNWRAACISCGQARYLFSECLLAAVVVAAEQPPDSQVNQQLPTGDRRVRQPPLVAAVHPAGGSATSGTGHRFVPGAGLDPHDRSSSTQVLDP